MIQDLIPLYIDGCCSEESRRMVEEHVKICAECRVAKEDMQCTTTASETTEPMKIYHPLNLWKASVMQAALLFLSFAVLTFAVALEAKTPTGIQNGGWAVALIIPSAAFMLSLANWFFVRLYPSGRAFSRGSMLMVFGIGALGYGWALMHYGWSAPKTNVFVGVSLVVVLGILIKILSHIYMSWLGKE